MKGKQVIRVLIMSISLILPNLAFSSGHTCCGHVHNQYSLFSIVTPLVKPIVYIGGAYLLIDHFLFDGKRTRELTRRFFHETENEITQLKAENNELRGKLENFNIRLENVENNQNIIIKMLGKVLAKFPTIKNPFTK